MKEKLVDELLNYFLEEDKRRDIIVPNTYEEKRKLLRGLINIREPQKLDSDILSKERELLKLELKEKEIFDVNTCKNQVFIYQGDITTIQCDAIVNACNEYLLGCFIPNHACIDNQIHTYAGMELRLKCHEIMKGKTLDNGQVVLTKGYQLPCHYIIHTVGPRIFKSVKKQDERDLKNCYIHSLELARKHHLKSIVFPCISTGIYGYPKEEAAILAYHTVLDYLKEHDEVIEKVVFNVFTDEDRKIYERVFKS